MPLQGAPPILPPPRGGGKAKFPMPLDHPSSGLHGPGYGTSGYGVVAPHPPRSIPRAAPARPPRAFTGLTPPSQRFEHAAAQAGRSRERAELKQPGVQAKLKVLTGPGQYAREIENIRSNPNLRGQIGTSRLAGGLYAGLTGQQAQRSYEGQYGEEHAKTQDKLFGLIPSGTARSPLERAELGHVPRSTGIVTPEFPGLKLLGGAALGGKGLEALTGKGGGGVSGKLYNEALSTIVGGPRAFFESVERPTRALKGIEEAVTHPGEHPIQVGLMGFGGIGALDRGAGALARKAGKASQERANAVVGAPGHTIEVGRQYAAGLAAQGAQRAFEKAQNAVGLNPNVLRTANIPLFGSKLRKAVIGGVYKPGRVDIHHGAANLTGDLAAAKATDFVNAHRPSKVIKGLQGDAKTAHDEAIMPYIEGYAENPQTYWADIEKREARLLEERKQLTGPTARNRNQSQIEQLQLIKEHRGTIGEQPVIHEQAARAVTEAQKHTFVRELLEGHLQPDQFHARLIGYGLEHGEKLGRGTLRYVKEGGRDPLIEEGRKAKISANAAKNRLERARGAGEGIDKARAEHQDAKAKVQKLEREIADNKAMGVTDHEGNLYHGLYDESNQRVDMRDLAKLYAERTGGREPGFITHKDEALPIAKGQYKGARPGSVTQSRTGEHALQGNYENHFGALVREFRKSARNLNRYRTENQMVEHLGINSDQLRSIPLFKHRGTGAPITDARQGLKLAREGKAVRTTVQEQRTAMTALADRLNNDPDSRVQAVRRELGDWKVYERGPERVLTSPSISDSRYSLLNQIGQVEGKALREREGVLKFTLIPEKVLDRLEKHEGAEHPNNPIVKLMKQVTGYQRHVALYSTPRWPVGLTQENMIRVAAVNTNPLVVLSPRLAEMSRAYRTGRAFLDGVREAAGNDLREIQTNSAYSVPEKAKARDHAALLEHGSMVGSEMRELLKGGISKDVLDRQPEPFENVASTGGIKQGLAAWNDWKEFLGERITNMENRARVAAAGHILLRELKPEEIKGLLKQQDQIVHQVVRGKLDPVAATRFTEQMLDIVGNWSHLTPYTRELRSWIAPFGLWWLNSMKFVFKTMPLEHPLKTAVWAALVAATNPDQRAEYKQGSIHVNLPFVGPVDYSLTHYSPVDVAHEPTNTAESMILPWYTEVFERAGGINQLYHESVYSKEEAEGKGPQNVSAAAQKAAMSFVPFGQTISAFARQGGSPREKGTFPEFEAQPGSQKGLLKTAAKAFSPVPFTYTSKKEQEQAGGTPAPPGRGQLGVGRLLGPKKALGGGKLLGPGKALK